MSMNLTRAGGGGSGKSLLTVPQGSPQHRTFQAIGWGLLVLAILLVPIIFPNFRVSQFAQAVAIGVTILGLNLVIGYGGLVSLGHIAFMGIGAYTSLILFTEHGWPFWTTWPVAALICFVIGVIVGLPALKIRGLYLALTTFALAYTFPILLKIDAWAKHTGGDNGKSIKPNQELRPPHWVTNLPIFSSQNPNEREATYKLFVFVLVAAVMFLLVRNLLKSRPGRAIVAIRDNETGAATSGVNLRYYKLMTFGVSAAVSGIGGCLFFLALNSVGPSSFDGQHTILLLMGLVVGGVATLHGAWLGGLVFVFLQDWASRVHATWIPYFRIEKGSQLTQVVFGLVLVLVAFFAPGGLMSLCRRIKARVIKVVPKPPTRAAEPVPAAELSPLPAPPNPLHIPSDQPART